MQSNIPWGFPASHLQPSSVPDLRSLKYNIFAIDAEGYVTLTIQLGKLDETLSILVLGGVAVLLVWMDPAPSAVDWD